MELKEILNEYAEMSDAYDRVMREYMKNKNEARSIVLEQQFHSINARKNELAREFIERFY